MYFKFAFLILLICGYSATCQIDQKHITNYSPEINRSGEAVYAVTIDSEGILYFATSNGILVYDGESWQSFSFNGLLEARSIEYDSRTDRIYLGGIGTFGYLVKNATNRYSYVSLSSRIVSTIHFKNVWQIFLDQGKVMFQSNEGFFSYTSDSLTFIKIKDAFVYKAGDRTYISETGGYLYELKQDSLYKIWDHQLPKDEVAFNVLEWTENQHLIFYIKLGVFQRNLNTNQFTPFKHPWSNIVKEYNYYNGITLSDSLFAIATWRDGIIVTDFKGKIIDRWTTENGLNSNGVYDMAIDPFGKLWLATEYGISTIDFRKALSNQSFPTLPTPKSKVVSVSMGRDSTIYTTKLVDTLYFNREPDYLKINFTTPGLSYFVDSAYQYFLEGYDTAWIETQGIPSATYLKIPNGSYLFKVKNAGDGIASSEGQLIIIIDEPWYAFLFGTVGYSFLILLAVIVIALLVMNGYRHRQKLLIKLVKQKTKEIEIQQQKLIDTNKNLTEANEELDTFLYRSSHDLVSPVKSIKGLINLLKLSKDNRDDCIQMLEERIGKLESILLEINGYVKNSKGNSVNVLFNFRDLVDNAWSSLEFMDDANGMKFTNEINETVEFNSDKEGWQAIISNLLSNSIKYHDSKKPASFIKVSSHSSNGKFELEVADNGQGIQKELQGRLFEMFYRAHETSTGSGLGLFLVKKMVTKLKGNITIESIHQQGTKVKITIPMQ